jgi:hypothetical protein
MMRHLLAMFVLSSLAAALVDAQVLDLTPELVTKIKRLAEDAKSKHPTSPTDAAYAFQAAFNGEFGDVRPAEAYLEESEAMQIRIWTPLVLYVDSVMGRLAKLEPIPDPLAPRKEILGGARYSLSPLRRRP